tara:strand:- start:4141 stop:4359 length:219 start_codon:yes stop_codon:yes gene_type:complete
MENENMNEEENIVYRVTSLKSNGSVWTKTYEDSNKLAEVMPILIGQYPHVVISRQVLKKPHLEYLRGMKDGN